MKKLIAISSAIMAFSLLVAPAVFAVSGCTPAQIADGICQLPEGKIKDMATLMAFMSQITNWMFAALLIMAVIFIIIGGFTYISSKGDPKAIGTAKNYIIYALVGVAVGVLAKGLVMAVCGIMGVACTFF